MATPVPISALPSATTSNNLSIPAVQVGTTVKVLTGTGANTLPYNNASGVLVANLDLGGSLTGILPLSNGGTNANLTASSGGIVYSTPFAFGIMAGTSTAGQVLRSGSLSAPSWSTATYPATTIGNQLLYSSASNTITGLATATNGVLITSAGGVPSIASTLPSAVQGNITTLGTVTTGVWSATSIDLAHGGTNANLTASNGGIFYSTATAGAILAGTATASKMLLSGASTTPTWSTSTIPTSAGATANKVLLSDGTNYVLSTPTFPNASATAGKFIRSDGTNWAAASSTIPDTFAQGDTIYASAANTLTALAKNTTATRYVSNTGTSNNPAWAQVDLTNGVTGQLPAANINTSALSDVQVFSSSGTWTKPTVGNSTYIYVVGGGGGGGSGRRGATASGGGGGAGGSVSEFTIPKSQLAASETVIVGTGGTGGAAQTVDSTDGNPGVAGNDSIFRHSGVNWLSGKGGGGGGGGSTGTVSGGAVGSPSDYLSGAGGNGNVGAGGVSGTPAPQAAGPGGGGGGNNAGVASNGGAALLARGGVNSGGSAPGGNGNSGLLSLPTNTPGGGGSGGAGAGSGVTPAGNGGNGGAVGGGGGGGGGSANGANSGKGGDGANGIVIVITF